MGGPVDSLIGKSFSRYRVLERIGAGGMGVVYRALDERLNRDVAMKVLPPDVLADEGARNRFRKEALALSKLNHPNVATVHDFDTQEGIDFLVMEYVAGEMVNEKARAGRLPEREVSRLGVQLAEGLAAAHAQGVIHRDLKPGNLRLAPDGRLKILDFGLAKLVAPSTQDAQTMTATGTTAQAGTLPYMAPEQLLGEPADARSDIWAAGTVLYELATGQMAFHGDLASQVTNSILHEAPVTPRALNARITPDLERVLLKCLEKDPENRYQSAAELAVDLRRLGASTASQGAPTSKAPARRKGIRRGLIAAGISAVGLAALLVGLNVGGFRERVFGGMGLHRIKSLAVLPLANISGDPEQEYFVDGMTEALITDLAQIAALRVISHTSVLEYRATKKRLPEIARELGVDAVVEGSALRSGGRIRITAKLIRAKPEQNLWSKSYDRDLHDVLTLQSEVARAVAEEIRVKLNPLEERRLRRVARVNPEAHDAYLRGRYYWNKGEPDDLEKAKRYFQDALEKDPLYAPAYAGLADYYSVLPFYTGARPDDVFPQAKAAVTKALELDESLSEAHGSLAYILAYYEWNWDGAGKEFERALELNPNDATLRHRYSRYLSSLGRVDEALTQMARARELDPLSLIIKANVGVIRYFGRQYDQAREQMMAVLRESPDFSVAHWGLGLVYEQTARNREALAEFEKAVALSHRGANSVASLGHAYAVNGNREGAQKALGELRERAKKEPISAFQIALVNVGLGDKDAALAALEEAYRERSTLLTYLKMDPRFDPLRGDPRFQDLLRRIGLPA